MSVINQMLKDLDNRKAEQNPANASSMPIQPASSSPRKVILLTFLVTSAIAIITVLIWQLYQENMQLAEQVSHSESQLKRQQVEPISIDKPTMGKIKADKDAILEAKPKIVESLQNSSSDEETPSEITNSNKQVQELPSVVEVAKQAAEKIIESKQVKEADGIKNKPLVSDSKPDVKPSMSVSRRQVSVEQLVGNKMQQAEQAIANNNAKRAESLFEDVLLLQSENKTARKQLAALWYGRQAYRDAVNLLQQGINLDSQDSSLRLLQARVYLAMQQTAAAFSVLSSLDNTEDIEYQTLLATSAQQTQHFKAAAKAYRKLTEMQPQQAKWWLGLAVAYDSDSHFDLAATSYRKALSLSGLSRSAIEFAQQRLNELGE